MKKWYVITGILALLWLISLGTCSSNSGEVDRLKGELKIADSELSKVKGELTDVRGELEGVSGELKRLKTTKEINFGNGLRVFDIKSSKSGVWGKVENVSDEAMEKAIILVTFYDENGELEIGYGWGEFCKVYDLFPSEVMEWDVYGYHTFFDIYAIGSKR